MESKSESKSVRYSGGKERFPAFEKLLAEKLLTNGIFYITNAARVQALEAEPDVPLYDFRTNGTQQVLEMRKETRNLQQRAYAAAKAEHAKALEKLEKDHGMAIGLLCGLIDEFVRASIEHIILDPDMTTKAKYTSIRAFIRQQYGPVTANDAETIMHRVRKFRAVKLSDYKSFFQLVADSQSLLRMIIKIDCDGNPKPDGKGGVDTYEMDDDTLRSILDRLLAHTPVGSALHSTHIQIITNDRMTYEMIKHNVENIIKHDEDYADEPMTTVLDIAHSHDVAPALAGAATAGKKHPRDNYHTKCSNCGSGDHQVWDCESKTCFRCTPPISFKSVQERNAHGIEQHSKHKKNKTAHVSDGSKQTSSVWASKPPAQGTSSSSVRSGRIVTAAAAAQATAATESVANLTAAQREVLRTALAHHEESDSAGY